MHFTPNIVTRRFAVTLVLAAVSLPLLVAATAPVETTVIPNVSPVATDGNGQQKLVAAADGRLYLIYATPQGDEDAIVVSRSDDGGATWVRDGVLSRPGIEAKLGSLAFDAAGTLHAAWVDYETVGHVWYAARTDDAWSDGIKISPGPTYAGFPVVAAGRDSVDVLWYSAPPDDATRIGSRYEIRHTSKTPQGWSDPLLVSTGSPDSVNPSVVADRDGNVHGAWYQLEGQTYRVNYSVWDANQWTEPVGLSPVAQNATQVSIDIAPDGTTYLVWGQYQVGVPGIAFSALTDGSWSDPVFLTEGPAEDPVLAVEPDGDAIVAWSADEEIFLLRSQDREWLTPERIGSGVSPTFATGEQLLLAWTRPTSTGYELAVADLSEAGAVPLPGLAIGAAALAAMSGTLTFWRRRHANGTATG